METKNERSLPCSVEKTGWLQCLENPPRKGKEKSMEEKVWEVFCRSTQPANCHCDGDKAKGRMVHFVCRANRRRQCQCWHLQLAALRTLAQTSSHWSPRWLVSAAAQCPTMVHQGQQQSDLRHRHCRGQRPNYGEASHKNILRKVYAVSVPPLSRSNVKLGCLPLSQPWLSEVQPKAIYLMCVHIQALKSVFTPHRLQHH